MKRRIRLISVIVLLCICGTFLASCEYIDGLREQQAVLIHVGDEVRIEKDGKTYIRIDGIEEYYTLYFSSPINITAEDVPVLLSKYSSYREQGNYFAGCDLIRYHREIYCPEDKYDEYSDLSNHCLIDKFRIRLNENSLKQDITEKEQELIFSIWNEDNGKDLYFSGEWLSYPKKIEVVASNKEKSILLKDDVYLTYNERLSEYGIVVSREIGSGSVKRYSYRLYTVPDDKEIEFRNIINKYYEIMSQSVIAP